MEHSIFVNDFHHLFETKENWDVVFQVGGKEIKAHRQILALMSDIFQLQLFSPIWAKKDENGKIIIKITDPNISVENFEIFIKFFYAHKIEFSGDNVFAIFHLGNFFNVQNIVKDAEKFIWKHLSEENLVDIANSAIFVNSEILIQKCVQKIIKHRFLNQNFFNSLNKMIIIEVLKCNKDWQMKTDEIFDGMDDEQVLDIETALFHLVVGWGKHQLEVNKMKNNHENLKKMLQDLLPLIRFPLIPNNVFYNQVWPTGLLNTEDYEKMMQIKKSTKNHEFPFSNISRRVLILVEFEARFLVHIRNIKLEAIFDERFSISDFNKFFQFIWKVFWGFTWDLFTKTKCSTKETIPSSLSWNEWFTKKTIPTLLKKVETMTR